MTWEAFHHRGDVLHRVFDEVRVRRDGVLPMDLPGVAETFRDELDLLGALQLRWSSRLSGKIERELSNQPMDLEAAVIAAWRATADELPGIREIQDHYRSEPVDTAMSQAMAKAAAKERQLLAVMAGRVSALEVDEHGARVGAAIEAAARDGYQLPEPDPTPGNVRFLDRIRAALAA
ncbi:MULTISPECIES: hypothetical protein [unclassified Nocardioides]|uniref:hypothetical protein n=1 Tax=unclassified Nocardioides TaxID=2615069 RepID=UPI0006FAABF2|nr:MULTISPECIES: hypothetical protein [unclassified Nocardioides]KQY63532.1 hypothetical protein ASD30_00480 [Nocardioides sp. Root140]KQZ67432.1 hypothetical protein ASD66_21040 [Nocardioides sp. Root151]KRF17517.1 hypothetical protein ASH02_24960 [Nocardioides sp. Soil796]